MTASILHVVGEGAPAGAADADPIRTEVIRHGLNSAAEQMKRALVRTAFSPIIYEVLDFAVAIYDRQMRLLAQAPSLPIFMGTLSYCVEAAVEAVGGEDTIDPGDVVLFNSPYGTGSHPQDAALVAPVHLDGVLLGYCAIKAHWLDIGGKEPYSTDTVDVFQEGTVFPGVKLVRRGKVVDDVLRIVLANSRVPVTVNGDIKAELAGLTVGARALLRLVERYGPDTFWESVERMFDHGDAVMRSYLQEIPDGRYVGRGELDDDGVTEGPIPFEITVEIDGSDVVVDYSAAPAARVGPVNCPVPSTVSGARVALTMLAGGGQAPNEGHFRAIRVRTTPGTIFHPLHPSPCFLYAWPTFQAIDAIYRAIGEAAPSLVPASSGGDICALSWWGVREGTGEPWVDGAPHPVGQGGHRDGDGTSSLLHIGESATRFAPIEVWEARDPWIIEQVELATDSGGAGEYRGGLGVDFDFLALEDCWLTSALERTRNPAPGLLGGMPGRSNASALRAPDGTRTALGKATRVKVPKGYVYELRTGGGGGYGAPADRSVEAVRDDVRAGYVSSDRARAAHPHAFPDGETRGVQGS